jgi:hypothetical protein
MNARQTAAAKAEDWRRQDEVAERVKEASEQAAAAAALLVASNRDVALKADETRKELGGQLRVIHTLVNSQLTEALELALAAKIATLAATKALAVANQRQGAAVSPGDLDVIKLMESEITELRSKLADRKHAQDQVDKGKAA